MISQMFDIRVAVEKIYDKHRKEIMEKFDMTAIEVDLMLLLGRRKGSDVAADICRKRNIPKSHVSLAVNRLCSRGYIEREVNSVDRRITHLKITEKAEPMIKFGLEKQKEFFDLQFRGFTKEEISVYFEFLSRIYNNIKSYDRDTE